LCWQTINFGDHILGVKHRKNFGIIQIHWISL
jgi:hypothetical protein